MIDVSLISESAVNRLIKEAADADAVARNARDLAAYVRSMLNWLSNPPLFRGPRPGAPPKWIVVITEENRGLEQVIQSPVEHLPEIVDPVPSPPVEGIAHVGPEIGGNAPAGWRFVMLEDTVRPGTRITFEGRGYEKRVAWAGPFGTSYAYVPV